jgi:hypothetical protein
LNLRPPGSEFSGLFLADRTRSGFSGSSGPFSADWGPRSPSEKRRELFEFAGESSAFAILASDSRGRFNSPRFRQNSGGKSELFPEIPEGRPFFSATAALQRPFGRAAIRGPRKSLRMKLTRLCSIIPPMFRSIRQALSSWLPLKAPTR